MARTTPSGSKDRGKTAERKPPGGNRSMVFVLAGFTAVVVAAIVAFAVFSTAGGEAGNFTPNDKGLIPVGEKTPGFSAATAGGGSVSVGGAGGAKATMLVFFATWCPHCQKEAPVISELEEQYEGLRVVLVGIDREDDLEKVQKFADEYDIQSPAVYEPSLGTEYGVSGYPTVYVLDGEDEVVGAHAGEAPRELYEGWIEEAL